MDTFAFSKMKNFFFVKENEKVKHRPGENICVPIGLTSKAQKSAKAGR